MSVKYHRHGLTPVERFWNSIEIPDDEGCWLWMGFRNANGYGRIRWEGPQVLAHRVSYRLNIGPIPEGMSVLHRCDNPPCVRPGHLYLGTKADNARDMVERGRRYQPTVVPNRKLTRDAAWLLRQSKPRGTMTRSWAALFGVSPSTIRRVLRGETYR